MQNMSNNSANVKRNFNASAVRLTRENKNRTAKEISGPVAKSFNFDEESQRKFKGGLQASGSQPLCKGRYQQISITPLGDIATESARILQAVSSPLTYNLTIQVSTTQLEEASSAIQMAVSAFALLFVSLAILF